MEISSRFLRNYFGLSLSYSARPSYQSESHSDASDHRRKELSRVEVQNRVGAVATKPPHYGQPKPQVRLNLGVYRGMVSQWMEEEANARDDEEGTHGSFSSKSWSL